MAFRRGISLDKPIPASSHPDLGIPKGETRKTRKAREDRIESEVAKAVRALVVARDGYCRLAGYFDGLSCKGPSEWAHMEGYRRARTRGMAPGERHTTGSSAIMCREHHRRYDAHEFLVEFLTPHGADGVIRWRRYVSVGVTETYTEDVR